MHIRDAAGRMVFICTKEGAQVVRIPASKCRLFTDRNTSYVLIDRILTRGGLRACLKSYAEKIANPYGTSYPEIVKEIMGPVQRSTDRQAVEGDF